MSNLPLSSYKNVATLPGRRCVILRTLINPMNTKSFLLCIVAVTLAMSVAAASPHSFSSAGGTHFGAMPAGGGARHFVPNGGARFSGHGGDFHHHHDRDFDNFVFFGGFPFWGWGWGYPYYGYPYGYGYYPYGYPYYGYYGNGYYGGGGYGYGSSSRSSVAGLQRRLAQAGYYHGSIDGIMGPQTRRALRNYQRDHGPGAYG